MVPAASAADTGRMSSRCTVTGVLIVACVVAGCGGHGVPEPSASGHLVSGPSVSGPSVTKPSVSEPSESEPALGCGSIGSEPPSSDARVVLGVVALPDPSRAPALRATRQADTANLTETWFAKTGLGIRSGAEWRLSVAPESAGHLLIGWGSSVVPVASLSSPTGCAAPSPGAWLWYPGGFWTDQPGCYAVIVESGGRTERLPVGVGSPCEGQQPPADVP